MKNEKTGKKVAAIAGRVLRMAELSKQNRSPFDDDSVWSNGAGTLTIADLKALAASALTQTSDKPKPVKKAKGRK